MVFWFTFIIFKFLSDKKTDIRFIPKSIILFLLIINFTPYYNVFTLTEKSQILKILSSLGVKDIFHKTDIETLSKQHTFREKQFISSRVKYLYNIYGYKSLEKITDIVYIQENFGKDNISKLKIQEWFPKIFGFEYIENNEEDSYKGDDADTRKGVKLSPIEGNSNIYKVNSFDYYSKKIDLRLNNQTVSTSTPIDAMDGFLVQEVRENKRIYFDIIKVENDSNDKTIRVCIKFNKILNYLSSASIKKNILTKKIQLPSNVDVDYQSNQYFDVKIIYKSVTPFINSNNKISIDNAEVYIYIYEYFRNTKT